MERDMPRINWLLAVGSALLFSGLIGSVQAGPWTGYHHCPKPSYPKINYWAPELFCLKAYMQKHPPFLYAENPHPEIPYDFQFQTFPCPATYPQTLYAFPQLDRPRTVKPKATDGTK